MGGMPLRATTSAGRAAIVIFLALSLAACAQPVRRVSRDESFVKPDAGRMAWRKVAILPFTGEPAFRRVAPEWLAYRVRKHGLFEVVAPSLAEIELKKKGIFFADAGTTLEEAQQAGRLLGVDGVVFGSIDPVLPDSKEMPTVRASVVDMATGKVVASGAQSYFKRARFAQEQVIAAVDRTGEDFVPVLYAAVGKTWTPPPKPEAQGSGPQGQDVQEREPALR